MDPLTAIAAEYASALGAHEMGKPETDSKMCSLFTEDATWIDPVGGEQDAFVGHEGIKKLFSAIPNVLSCEVKEVFYTASEKIFLVKYEVKLEGQPEGAPPAVLL